MLFPSFHKHHHVFTDSYRKNINPYVGLVKIQSPILNLDVKWGFKYICNGCQRDIYPETNYYIQTHKCWERLKPNQTLRIITISTPKALQKVLWRNGNISEVHRSLFHPLATVRHRMWAGPETSRTNHNNKKNTKAHFANIRKRQNTVKNTNKQSLQIRMLWKEETYLCRPQPSVSCWYISL